MNAQNASIEMAQAHADSWNSDTLWKNWTIRTPPMLSGLEGAR